MRPAVWIDAEHLGEHVHVKVSTGQQHGQDDVPFYGNERGWRNDAGEAGRLILREDQWPGFIRAFAIGGHATGLRVVWRLTPDDGRFLWNAHDDAPAIVGQIEPVSWCRTVVADGQ